MQFEQILFGISALLPGVVFSAVRRILSLRALHLTANLQSVAHCDWDTGIHTLLPPAGVTSTVKAPSLYTMFLGLCCG